MNTYAAVRLVVETLQRRRMPVAMAIDELQDLLADEDAARDVDGALMSWRACVMRETLPEQMVSADAGNGLDYRQAWIVSEAIRRGRVAARDVLGRWPVGRETVRLDFVLLCQWGRLRPRGSKKGRYYEPVPEGEQVIPIAGDMPSEDAAT